MLKAESAQARSKTREILSRLFPKQVQLDFTVAICTYNGEQRLPDVLENLCWQLNTHTIQWEVIVVDNNSSDGTAQVVKDFQARWPDHSTLRYAFEGRQGAGFARHKAVQIARSPLVGFLDDDNLPTMTWVVAAYRFGCEHTEAGVYGSRIYGDFEITPPENFERISGFLAITDRGHEPRRYPPQKKVLPPGAGMVVRRQAWLDNVPTEQVLAGRIENREAGEDLEAVLYIQRAGWEVWYNPHMRLYHRIPGSRLQRDYLIRLCRGIGLSRYHTRMLSCPTWQQPVWFFAYLSNDVRKLLKHLMKYRGTLKTDIVAACEMTLYVYSLLSPFYIWQRSFRRYWQRRS
ncbi:MAG: glycosyltransferase family 2 protein [Leptolyngbyaceae cyanobacterium SM1_1_3]|nr:glycosyltransferase family 2 protein [Leptolyngbyaceae cyanobacterium SM1_1_3]NJN03247.1 glycosyltransferase family 2 protein [Leptolyngbyaceae cyanobacterium RM1_1_2]NJO11219.1 glycosyltransferase family 2 protein [Leptolyngbyaceae cyanobacterium SL_1_1]